MGLPWLAEIIPGDNVTFRRLQKEYHVPMCPQAGCTQCYSKVTGVQWLLDTTVMGNATSHHLKKEFPTPKFLQAMCTRCY
mmetsp:Transcript_32524/g.52455  ORF Transcript_32524/g.52455 Transcript_32524/m.52455 type:complete len:80 (-) Transcript_32524:873-1112(-)